MMRKTRTQRHNLKLLSTAVIAGLAFAGCAVQAEEIDLRDKPVATPTLDYLRENNVKIPQVQYDSETKTFVETGETIDVPESAYTIENGTPEDYSFIYQTADQSGNITDSYYKIELKNDALNTSSSVTWTELKEAPAEGTSNTVTIKLPNDVTKYYQYSYTKPADYTNAERINDTLINANVNKVVFENLTSSDDGTAIYNTQDNSNVNIVADIINNSSSKVSYYRNAAIYNYRGAIGDITGTFIGNSERTIYNYEGTIKNISGDFIGNTDAAIYNSHYYMTNTPTVAVINNITGNFIGNSSYAIYNDFSSKIGDITGNFIGNSNSAINNYGSINRITGDFINNSASNSGGAISGSTIGSITGDFINNSASNSGGAISGGANSISGNFINNSAGNSGGAMNISAKDSNIKGNFINNSAGSNGGAISGGAIGSISGNFINNSAGNNGGAIYEYSALTNSIFGNFINNTAAVSGGGIYTGGGSGSIGVIGDITGNFVNNLAKDYDGGAICNSKMGGIYNITGDFINNSAGRYGGAISNDGTIGKEDEDGNLVGGILNSNFYGNYAKSETSETHGGAIYTSNDLNIIANNGKTSTFSGNYVEDKDGLRYEGIYVDYYTKNDNKYANVEDTGYTTLYTEIGKSNTLSLISEDNGKIIIDDEIVTSTELITVTQGTYYEYKIQNETFRQYVEYDEEKGIYVKIDTPEPEVLPQNKLVLNGDSTGEIHLNNAVKNFDVSLSNTNVFLGKDNVLNGNNLTLNSGSLNMVNNDIGISALNSLTVTGDTNFVADVDLENQVMDRFTANSYGEHSGNLNVVGMNLLSDAPEDRQITEIYFAQPGLKNNVTNGTGELPDKYQTEFYTPIYKYNAAYDNRDDGGYFVFAKGDKILTEQPDGSIGIGGSTGNPSDAFNPAVLSAPVSGVAAAQSTINESFKYVFEHADAFTQLPSLERTARINANKYALNTSTDYNYNLGSLNYDLNNKAGWVRPYATFENMHLKNGPKVDAINYGTLVGFDTDFKEHKHGWYSVGTGYIGYNGSQLKFKGVDTTMNGGLLGYTHTRYKGNFWTALTLSAGASVGESRTMYGKEDFTSLMAGVGSKTGYNFEFKEGKYILQPIMFMSYTFVNTFDYTNAAGVKIKPSPAHSIQLNPSVRFIANTKKGWQPYASVGMVWNVMNENKVTANNVRLPEMGMKPYVEYGLGVQRNWKDKFTAFGQAMLRNGGRNGIAFTAGFRWAIGHDGKPIEKVQAPDVNNKILKQVHNDKASPRSAQNVGTDLKTTSQKLNIMSQQDILAKVNGYTNSVGEKKIVKQLTPTQKSALGLKDQNTTRTTNSAILKQL